MSEILGHGSSDDDGGAMMREATIALDQWPVDMIREPSVDMADIYAIQALTMGYLRKRARYTMYDENMNRYMFSMRDSLDPDESRDETCESMYDGSQDRLMTCRLHKLNYDQWRMTATFVDTTNTLATKSVITRDLYRFDWLRNGNRQAWYSSTTRIRSEEGLHLQVNRMEPITSDVALELQNRMLELSQSVNPISTDSILIPTLPVE